MRPARRRRASRIAWPAWPAILRPALAGRSPLRGREWTPGRGLEEDPARNRRRRAAAGAVALVELLLLAGVLAGGAFRVGEVAVTGNHRLTAAQVRAEAGLTRPGSVFAVDASAIRRRLRADAWIRDAEVSASLPGRVDVHVEEWQPAAVLVSGEAGRAFFLSDQAVVLGPAPSADGALEVDVPGAADLKVGQRPLEVRLLTAMVNIRRALPSIVGQDVRSFEVDGCGNLTMTTGRGWKAYFGRVITPEEFSSLDAKLSALKAVSTAENLNSPDVEYVNLMNASLPAVGHRPKPAASPSPQPRPAATAAPSPQPITPIVTCR